MNVAIVKTFSLRKQITAFENILCYLRYILKLSKDALDFKKDLLDFTRS